MSVETDIAIRLTNVSKSYKIYDNMVTGPLRQFILNFSGKQHYRSFEAVKDVNLEVKRGEIVGLVGPNGCGKTTLLKMIAGLLVSTHGQIEINGKVTALMALGVGIHPEFTGRENIYFGGILMGMSKDEIESKIDSIISFAEIGDYIEMPFRTYSSGMQSRLLFSISMSVDPDILIVDEALATGDAYFMRKCARRIEELTKRGSTILFVSHNHQQVQRLCQRALLMWQGEVVAVGDPGTIIAKYNRRIFDSQISKIEETEADGLQMIAGTGDVQIADVRLKDEAGRVARGFFTGDRLLVELDYKCNSASEISSSLFVGFLDESDGTYIGFYNSVYGNLQDPSSTKVLQLGGQGTLQLTFEPLLLHTNEYSLWIMVYSNEQILCEYQRVMPFFVSRKDDTTDRHGHFIHPGVLENIRVDGRKS